MTLGEMLRAAGRALKKHDYEFLVGDDGLAHLVIVVDVTGPADNPSFTFFCPCAAIMGLRIVEREIAPGITCLTCSSR